MRIMGIDFGSKRVGIALTDEQGTMAFPLEVILNDRSLVATLEKRIHEKEVMAIVIGHSQDGDGRDNAIQDQIEALILDLTLAVGIPVYLEPERYTTQAALRIQGRNAQTDASAAALILDSYIQRNK